MTPVVSDQHSRPPDPQCWPISLGHVRPPWRMPSYKCAEYRLPSWQLKCQFASGSSHLGIYNSAYLSNRIHCPVFVLPFPPTSAPTSPRLHHPDQHHHPSGHSDRKHEAGEGPGVESAIPPNSQAPALLSTPGTLSRSSDPRGVSPTHCRAVLQSVHTPQPAHVPKPRPGLHPSE